MKDGEVFDDGQGIVPALGRIVVVQFHEPVRLHTFKVNEHDRHRR